MTKHQHEKLFEEDKFLKQQQQQQQQQYQQQTK